MTQPGGYSRRRAGWWGWNTGGSGWDDQGCLGCGLAWWIIAMCLIIVFGFWGWGVPGWGGWGGWGWRHSYYSNCPPAGAAGGSSQGRTNTQPQPTARPPAGTNGGAGGGPGGGAQTR